MGTWSRSTVASFPKLILALAAALAVLGLMACTGAQGPAGPQGPEGPSGPAGPAGAQGPAGDAASVEPPPVYAGVVLSDPVTGAVGKATFNPGGATTFNAMGAGFGNGDAIQFICCTGDNSIASNVILSLGGRFFAQSNGAWKKNGVPLPDTVKAGDVITIKIQSPRGVQVFAPLEILSP